jgi:voltage-gated potassium channel
LWWSLATITTVGYGHVAPITAAGRIVDGFTMIVGISVFAVITARIAAFFTTAESDSQVDRVATP